jgi:hypothetical protein
MNTVIAYSFFRLETTINYDTLSVMPCQSHSSYPSYLAIYYVPVRRYLLISIVNGS